jgi:hypothetical protein
MPNNKDNIKEKNITCNILRCNKIIGTLENTGANNSVDLSGGVFKVTATGFLLADQSEDVPFDGTSKLIKLKDGDLVISNEDGSDEEIILDTSNQGSEISKCDHMDISPDSNSGNILLYIKDITGNTANIVDIQTDSSTDPVFKISTAGQTTISNLVLTTADINGGTIDGTTIGASTATSGAFTTVTASTSLDVTGSDGIILQNDETITNSTDGTVLISGEVASGTHIFKSNGDNDVTLKTGNSTTGSITITDGANGNIAITPNGTGFVNLGKISLDTEVITSISGDILNTHPDKSVLYFNLSGNSTASIPNGTDGQVLHMFYGCPHNLTITFSGGLKCGSGTANTLTFNADGQSASLVFIGNSINKWCILNTGAVISTV